MIDFVSLRKRRRRAFTVLELLVVVVVLGILAGIALIRFGDVNEKAYVATMKSDLRNFVTAHALHLADGGVVNDVSDVENYDFSENVFRVSYDAVSPIEWVLVVGHDHTDTTCSVATSSSSSHLIECSEGDGSGGGEDEADETPLVANFTVNPSSPTTGQMVSFVGTSNPSPAGLTYSWDFGDGSETQSGSSVSHEFLSAGTYFVSLTVTDGGTRSATVEHMVSVVNAPVFASSDLSSWEIYTAWGAGGQMVYHAGEPVPFTRMSWNTVTGSNRESVGKHILLASGSTRNIGHPVDYPELLTLTTEWNRYSTVIEVRESGTLHRRYRIDADLRLSPGASGSRVCMTFARNYSGAHEVWPAFTYCDLVQADPTRASSIDIANYVIYPT